VQRYYSIVEVLAYPRRAMRLTDLVTPLKPLEAMAQGRLVLASDVGGHRELIRDGVNGALFRAGSADALARSLVGLLRGHPPAAELKRNGRDFVERERTWRNSVARYAPIYSRLTSGAPA
jgi:glycosyltransferase involved in cell wall biosynthesis